ncbi:hypothetical protein BGW39_002840, partial [Mortierella sp. 14UC]
MSNNLKASISLFTILNGDTVFDPFFVSIGTTQTVQELRRIIGDFTSHHANFKNSNLRNVAIDRLHLWRAIVPHPQALPRSMETFGRGVILLDNLLTKRKLGLNERIVDAFGGPENVPAGGM